MAKIVNLTGEEVVALTAQYMSESDVAIVQKALDYATKAHISQVRQSGEPYIIHPIQVARSSTDFAMMNEKRRERETFDNRRLVLK